MKRKIAQLALLWLISCIDIFVEVNSIWHFHQSHKHLIARFMDFETLFKWHLGTKLISGKETLHAMEHAAHHTLSHLYKHAQLINFSLAFAYLALHEPIFTYCAEHLKKYTFWTIRSFHGLCSYEMLLLHIESTIVLYYELHDYWSLLGLPNTKYTHCMWIALVTLILAPLNVYALVALEKRLKDKTPFVMAGIYTAWEIIMPAVLFFVARAQKTIVPSSLVVKDVSAPIYTQVTPSLPVDPDILWCPLARVIILPNIANAPQGLLETLAERANYELHPLMCVGRWLVQGSLNVIFAALMSFIQKRFLKRLRCSGMDGATAFLVVEEFLAFGFERYLGALGIAFWHACNVLGDKYMVQKGCKDLLVAGLLHTGCFFQQHMAPSQLFQFLNGEISIFARCENILSMA